MEVWIRQSMPYHWRHDSPTPFPVPGWMWDRARGEDKRQRDAAAVRAFDRNRIAARERRGRKQCGDPEEHGRAVVRGRERPGGEEHGTEADQAHGHDDWRKAPTHGSPSLTSAAYHSQLSKNHSA